jgi:hypothetical protein
VQQVEPGELKKLWALITKCRVNHDAFRTYLAELGLQSTKELSPAQLEQCLSEIDTRQRQAFQPREPVTVGDRVEPLSMLQAESAQAEQTQPPGEPHAQALMELAQWVPRVGRACENPDTPEPELKNYLAEVNQALGELREMMTEVAA